MSATTYNDKTAYLPYVNGGDDSGDCGCGCGKKKHEHEGGCNECQEGNQEPCGCEDEVCAPGLVAVFDDKGNNLGCLTPNDAELFQKNTYTCQDGYVKLFKSTGEFLGCVSETNFAALYAAVNP